MKRSTNFRHHMRHQGGFSLVELMIASTLGLLILSTMITVFVSTSQTRNEVDKSSRQIENGRFAIEMLREDIQLAAFYGDYLPTSTITWTTPDPCALILNNMGFTAGNVPVGIQGYPDTTATTGVEPSCLGHDNSGTFVADRKAGTDILVVRRVSTRMVKIDNDENGTADTNVTNEEGTTGVTLASLGGAYYFQASNCSDTPVEASYVMAKTPASFVLHGVKPAGTPASCMNGGIAPIRQYVVRIFYIATCNNCSGSGDGIPTLKMVELTRGATTCAADATAACGSMTVSSIAEGIENMQLEYGIDSDADGIPNSYSTAPATADWQNVIAVKIYLLARNTEITGDYVDSKTYSLASDGTTLTGSPFNDQYKRHVYAATVRAINIGNRR
jgi:type IV pilus assembly protein PilW